MGKSPQASSSDPSTLPDTKSEQDAPTFSSKAQPNGSTTTKSRAISEIVEDRFPPFDHQAAIVGPFEEETGRDQTFEGEIGHLMVDLIMETHAWAAARPKLESANAVGKYEKKIADIMEVEKEQGTSSPASLVGTLVPVGCLLTRFTIIQIVCALAFWNLRPI
ncbi:uncharacterized protein SCHCODRAFT_01193026 [Schizophyllum commune H4-8]|uniref:Uncharacterized protein n=1 Tax=Schizophyllum commune (strain H4-8 / FGSC 9210) TaxID=578458 RepID=D8QH87_SCHCM|nr:uncharacterized protein SCHCODRAFT_01193026 [Schizophyllum commune H4-8]KAI5887073.1 hypothetical protein SCHCODRAFT_01193026 [Schizophyllum commune H4-8]